MLKCKPDALLGTCTILHMQLGHYVGLALQDPVQSNLGNLMQLCTFLQGAQETYKVLLQKLWISEWCQRREYRSLPGQLEYIHAMPHAE